MQINKEPELEVIKRPIKKNQKEWTDYFNKKGLKMISATDIYEAIKKKDKVLESLRKDLKDDYIITSTRIDRKNNQIIHDADSKAVKEKKIKCNISKFNGNFKKNKNTETYLQALFDTKDSIKEILKNLNILGENREIRLWTSCDKDSSRAVGLYFNGDGLVVGSDWVDYNIGLSRGVNVSAPKEQGKSKRKSR